MNLGIKKYIQRLVYGYRASNETYINYLREKGGDIGNVQLFSPRRTYIDIQYPWMLKLGDNVRISAGVTILNHDYSWSVWKCMTGEIIGGVGKVNIANNVFIGMNTTILMNTEIESNVIIGANSLVSGKIKADSVYAGNPAKRLMSIEEYINKRKKRQLDDAKEIVFSYYRRFHKKPPKQIMPSYFWLFENDASHLESVFVDNMNLCGNYEMSLTAFNEHTPIYNSYDEFLDDVLKENKTKY